MGRGGENARPGSNVRTAYLPGALGRTYDILVERGAEVHQRYHVPFVRQTLELPYYYWRRGMGRAEYYMFELFRQDVSAEHRCSFLSQNAWTALSAVINHPRCHTDDSKLQLARRFDAAHLPAPVTLAYTSTSVSGDESHDPAFVAFEDLLSIVPRTGCVIKRDHSTWGLDVHVFDQYADGVFRQLDGRVLGIEDVRLQLMKRPGAYLVQERLENHPDLAFLRLPSLATVRILTYGPPGDVTVARAAFKLPVGRRGVDNYHAGGIAAPVDITSGAVGRGVASRGLDWLSEHPESGIRFADFRIPEWGRVLEVAKGAAQAFSEFACVGWDIALTPAGPLILEGNSVWGTDIVQRPHRRGIWEGEFREWCLTRVRSARLHRSVRRWIQ